jgi:hypothetical protein
MTIENTQDPASRELTSLLLLATGDTEAVIGAQEKAGQTQLVHSDCLPTELRSPREEFEALGFTFGAPDPHDPMFSPATLPDGWTKQGSDHDMWSYVVDERGRRRVGIFYKAAFYDRRADMHLIGLHGYVTGCVYDGTPIVTDDLWATREAVAAVLLEAAEQAQADVDTWQGIAESRGPDETSGEYIAKYTAQRDRYRALAADYTA